MPTFPVLLFGSERGWIEDLVAGVFRSIGPDFAQDIVEQCPKTTQICLVATDDLAWPGLERIVSRLVQRGERIVVLSWDDPVRLRLLRQWPIKDVVSLPAETTRLAAVLRGVVDPVLPLAIRIKPRLPGSLALAVRFLLDRAESPIGPAPPLTVVDLAALVKVSRPNLALQARRNSIDLHQVCEIAAIRWVRGRTEPLSNRTDLTAGLGYESERSLRRLVKRRTGLTLKVLVTMPISFTDALLIDALGFVLTESK